MLLPDIWYPAGYPAKETGYLARYRISKKAGYPAGSLAGWISGATLVFLQGQRFELFEELLNLEIFFNMCPINVSIPLLRCI